MHGRPDSGTSPSAGGRKVLAGVGPARLPAVRTGPGLSRTGPAGAAFARAALWILLLALCLVSLTAFAGTAPSFAQEGAVPTTAPAGAPPTVWRTRVAGVVDAPLAGFLTRTIEQATQAGVAALVVELDTPGGLDSAMREIIQAEAEAPIPVVFYVYPPGARSASAGVYLMMGSDVSAMAPQTNLGAAQPVSLTGEMDEAMRTKVINDAAAYMRSLAMASGRNAEWAERAVRESVSLTSTEAKQQNVIDFVATDLDDLLRQIDGFQTKAKGLTLHTAGAEVVEVGIPWWESFLRVLANPEIAFLLLLAGAFALIFELSAPGFGVPGVLGVVSILLALYGLQLLPVNWFGFALVIVAVGLYVAELFVTSFGLLTVAATVCLVIGSLLLFNLPQFYRLSWWVVGAAVALSLGFFGIVARALLETRRQKAVTGEEEMVGALAVALTRLAPGGQVRTKGEIWNALLVESEQDRPVSPGETLQVVSLEGLTLRVRRVEDGGQS